MLSYEELSEVFDMENPLTLEYFELCSTDTTEVKYKDKHHILPRSIFKEFEKFKWNIVKLNYSNHYRVHEILPFICINEYHRRKMLHAWHYLYYTRDGNPVSKEQFDMLKRLYRDARSETQKGKKQSPETIAKRVAKNSGASNPAYGIPKTSEIKAKIRETKKLPLEVLLERLKYLDTYKLVGW